VTGLVPVPIAPTKSRNLVLFGYDQGVFSGIVGNEDWRNTFGHPSSALEGIIVAIYNLGAFSGCILTFFIGEKLGRRVCMWFAMAWIVSGSSRLSVAQDF
jgi:MFS family permease